MRCTTASQNRPGKGEVMNPTAMFRLWSLQNVFLLWLVRLKVVELNENRCVVRIPLNWITRRRDIHAMYLGTLCMGADVAAGLIAFNIVAQRKAHVNFIFKDIRGSFLKRAESDVASARPCSTRRSVGCLLTSASGYQTK